ncbi:MAG: hypothetical protein GOU99_01900 [Candidatus Altiarchaeota archaeon]|nr:hypothetical protein [Candidatus Altiarchaeota archaeon]
MRAIELLVAIGLLSGLYAVLFREYALLDQSLRNELVSYEEQIKKWGHASLISALYSFGHPFQTELSIPVPDKQGPHSYDGFYIVASSVSYSSAGVQYITYNRVNP